MRLEFKITADRVNLPLPAECFLQNFEEMDFKAADYGQKHPIATYRVSVASTSRALADSLSSFEAYSSIHANQSGEMANARNHLYRDMVCLLNAVTEHFDDTRSIVFLFDEANKDGKKGKLLRDYNRTVADARNFFAVQANEIKHRQSRLQLLQAGTSQRQTIGYFITGVEEHGAIGPNPIVHAGGKTAFSFNRVFRQAITCVLFNSRAMATLLSTKFPASREDAGLGPLAEISRKISNLGNSVFWDEVLITPFLKFGPKSVEISTASRNSFCPPVDGNIETIFEPDNVSRTFSLPYAGEQTRPGVHIRKFAREI